MSNKKSSIEWLQAIELERDLTLADWNKAKAMHKEEMVEFSQEVFRNRYNQVYQSLGNIADDIYNETFENNHEQQ